MPNDFYTRAYNPLPEQRVSSQVLKDEFARVEAGFDEVQGDADRAIKLPVGTADQTLAMDAGARANLVLAFDASGNITAVAGGGRFRGDWTTATAYVTSDYFRDPASKNIYSVVAAHTSGVLATDISAGRVQLAINVEDVEAAKAVAQAAAAAAVPAASAADNARAAAVLAKDAAEDARDMAQTYAAAAGAAAGLPALAGQALKNLRVKSDETGVEWTDQFPVASITRALKTSAYTLTSADKGALIDCTGTWTLGFDAAATLGAGWWCYVRNAGAEAITLDPNAAEQIDGQATIPLLPGYTLLVQCDGTKLTTLTLKRRTYDNRQLITTTSTFTVPADTYVIRPYAFGAGSAGIGTSAGKGGGCAFGDIAVTPGEVVSFSIASGIAKVTTQSIDRLTANPAVTTVVGTASKHASVTNGGAYSGGSNGSGSPLGNGGFGLTLGLNPQTPPIDPLLFGLYGRDAPSAAQGSAGIDGNPGGIGGDGGYSGGAGFSGGTGGFGCKGGNGGPASSVTTSNGGAGGAGGFGGNGGNGGLSAHNAPSVGGTGGQGGFGGGGGGGGTGAASGVAGSPGAGGPAAIILIY